jgi:membrane associated rhomboid family serine protease
MIPIRDVIPSRTTPVVTMAIIAINVAVFLAAPSGHDPAFDTFIARWGVTATDFSLASVGTSMFVHAGWLHLFSNMLFLWIFGDNVEDRLGHGRYLLFYALCGLAAAAAQVLTEPGSTIPMVGASGAIGGVLGAYLVLFPHSRVLTLVPLFVFVTFIEIPAAILLGLWFAMQVLSGIGSLMVVDPKDMGGVAFWAHAGGFVAGLVLVLLFQRPERAEAGWYEQAAARPRSRNW